MLLAECIHGYTILKSTFIVDNDHEKIETAIKDLQSSIADNKTNGAKYVVGLDVHMSSNGHDFLHLSTATRHIGIDISHYYKGYCSRRYPPRLLHCFLQHVGISFLGVGIKFCVETLTEKYEIGCRNAVDLGLLAANVKGDKRLESFGLFDLAQRVCNIKVNPSGAMGEVDYGVVGAHLAFVVGNRLLGGAIPYVFKMYKGVVESHGEESFGEDESAQHKCIIRGAT